MSDEERPRAGTRETKIGQRPPRTIALTFDNLGEASALERGTWTGETPLGQDPSVTVALPALLHELDRHDLKATFFVEGINCEINPSAVDEIAARGHELGVHGWRHEPWGELAPAAEREKLERATSAFAARGHTARAFRPPGGALNPGTPELLGTLGYAWCSPAAGAQPDQPDGLAYLPFQWELVDAFHLMERFAPMRAARGEPEAAADPAALTARFARALTQPCAGTRTVILHPFLMLDDAWRDGVRELLGLLARLKRDGAARVLPGGALAR